MDKRAIAIKRKNLPLFEKLGVLSQPSVDLLLSEFANTESSFDSAVALRNSNKHTWEIYCMIINLTIMTNMIFNIVEKLLVMMIQIMI